jgi:hypothetical protein
MATVADVLARLDVGLRERLLALRQELEEVASIRIANGRLCADVPEKPYEDSRPRLTAVLKRLLETAQHLPPSRRGKELRIDNERAWSS